MTHVKLHSVNGSHFYECPNGTYPSVTTVLYATRPDSSVAKLEKWKRDVGPDVAKYIKDEAIRIGTEAHKLNECYLKGEAYDGPASLLAKAHHRKFRSVLARLTDIRAVEMIVYSDRHRFAGTVDCIAWFNGAHHVIDYKTKRKTQRSEWMEEYMTQMAGYAIAYEEATGFVIPRLAVLVSSEKDTFQEFYGTLEEYGPRFLSRLRQYYTTPGRGRMRVP